MLFFQNLTQLRAKGTDTAYFPHRQLAAKVFRMVSQTYRPYLRTGIRLRSDVTPEILEPCFARIFGKTLLHDAVSNLQNLRKHFQADDLELWLCSMEQCVLLEQTATKAQWGESSTDDETELSVLMYCLLHDADHIERFSAQAQKRIAEHS